MKYESFVLDGDSVFDFWQIKGKLKKTTRGVVVQKSTSQWVHDCISDQGVKTIEIQVDLIPSKKSGPIVFDMLPYIIRVNDAHNQSYIARTMGGNWLARSGDLELVADKVNRLIVRYSEGVIRVSLNGKVFTYKSSYKPLVWNIKIDWPSGSIIQNLKITGKKVSFAPISAAPGYDYHLTVDFPDDVIPAPFTVAMIDKMMENTAKMGVKRVYWIYYGGITEGIWDMSGSCALPDECVKKTFAALGPDDLAVAVAAGHKYGMEVYAIIKPFDMGAFGYTFVDGSDAAKKYGKSSVLGGKTFWDFNFPVKHPELCWQRRNFSTPKSPVIERIEISSIYPLDEFAGKIKIWVSENNHKYCQYKGPSRIDVENGKIIIRDLCVSEPFFAIQSLKKENDTRILNVLDKLITVFDEKGRRVEFTYGVMPRKFSKRLPGSCHLDPVQYIGGDFRKTGFFFDCSSYGSPTAAYCGDKVKNDLFALDNSDKVLGMALGKNKVIASAMCPSEPAARAYWMSLIKKALDCGVDGIDVRAQGHLNVLEWSEYGFNAPVVKEFKKRYGVNIHREDFSREKLRELRGEFYTLFLREAAREVRGHGKRFQIHIEDIMEGSRDSSCTLEIFWDWQKWLKEGLADGITLRAINANNLESHFGRSVVRECRKYNVPVYFQPFINWGVLFRPDWQGVLTNNVRNSGVNGFVIYEYSFLFVAQLDGTFVNNYKSFTRFITQLNS